MALDEGLIWSRKLVEYSNSVFTGDAEIVAEAGNACLMNLAVGTLPFASLSQEAFNSALAGQGAVGHEFPRANLGVFPTPYPENCPVSFEDVQTDFAKIIVRYQVLEHLAVDGIENFASEDFYSVEKIASKDNAAQYLLGDAHLKRITSERNAAVNRLHFDAIVSAFQDADYGFSPEHRDQFKGVLFDNAQALVAAGISPEALVAEIGASTVSGAVADLVSAARTDESLGHVAALLRACAPGGEAAFRAEIEKALPDLLNQHLTLTQLAAIHGDNAPGALLDLSGLSAIEGAGEIAGDVLDKIEALQAVSEHMGVADKAHLDAVVTEKAAALVQSVTSPESFERVVTILSASNAMAAMVAPVNAQIVALIQLNVPSASIAKVPGFENTGALCDSLIEKVGNGSLILPRQLLAVENFIRLFSSKIDGFKAALLEKTTEFFAAIDRDEVGAATVVVQRMGSDFVKHLENIDNLSVLFGQGLNIAQISQLFSGVEGYGSDESKAFREARLNALVSKMEMYLETIASSGAGWTHKLPGDAEAVDCDVAAIQAQLGAFKAQFEQYNLHGIPAYQVGQQTDRGNFHGTSALQAYVQSHPLMVDKIKQLYAGDIGRVKREFALYDIGVSQLMDRSRAELANKIDRAAGPADLNKIVDEIGGLSGVVQAGLMDLFRSAPLKFEAAKIAQAHVLDVDTLQKLLGNGIAPDAIVAFCQSLIALKPEEQRGFAPTVQTIAATLKAKLNAAFQVAEARAVRGEAVNVQQDAFLSILRLYDRFPEALNRDEVTGQLGEKLHRLSKAGLISEANYAELKPLLSLAGDSLEDEFSSRINQFFTVEINALTKTQVMAKLAVLGEVAPDALKQQVFGDMGDAAVIGKLSVLMEKGLCFSEILSIFGLDDAQKPSVSGKISQFLRAGLHDLQSTADDITAEQKAENAKNFSAFVTVFTVIEREVDVRSLLTEIEGNVAVLLKNGVAVKDFLMLGVSRSVMESAIAAEPAFEGKADLLRSVRTVQLDLQKATAFFDSLSPQLKESIQAKLHDFNIPPFEAQQEILQKAFQEMHIAYAACIEDNGTLNGSHVDTAACERAYEGCILRALESTAGYLGELQEQSGLLPGYLSNAEALSSEMQNLRSAVMGFQKSASTGRIEKMSALLQKVGAQIERAHRSSSEDALRVLKLAQTELERFSSSHVPALETLYSQDRVDLEALQMNVENRFFAVSRLIGADKAAVFRSAVLGEMASQWSDERVLAALRGPFSVYLNDPGQFFKARLNGFSDLNDHLSLVSDAQKAALASNMNKLFDVGEAAMHDAVYESLIAQDVSGRLSRLHSRDALKSAAKTLFTAQCALSMLRIDLDEKVAKPLDVAKMATDVEALKSTIATYLTGKEAQAAENVGKSRVVFDTKITDAVVGEHIDAAQLSEVFSGGADDEALGVTDADIATAENAAKVSDLIDRRQLVVLHKERKLFAEFDVMARETDASVVAVKLACDGVRQYAAEPAGSASAVNLSELSTEDFAALAVKTGAALAQAKIDVTQRRAFTLFGAAKTVSVSGKFTGDASKADIFEVAVMETSLRNLTRGGYAVDGSTDTYKRFSAAREKYFCKSNDLTKAYAKALGSAQSLPATCRAAVSSESVSDAFSAMRLIRS